MTDTSSLASGIHADDIPALLDRIAALRAMVAERDMRIRQQEEQVAQLRGMLAMHGRTP